MYKTSDPTSTEAESSSGTGVTRRNFLELTAAGTVVALTRGRDAMAGIGTDPIRPHRLEQLFDLDWLFYRGDASGAEAATYDDSSWRKLDVPHDWRIEDLPNSTSDDGGATADPSVLSTWSDNQAPRLIGPFDADADPVPDADFEFPSIGHIVMPGGGVKVTPWPALPGIANVSLFQSWQALCAS